MSEEGMEGLGPRIHGATTLMVLVQAIFRYFRISAIFG
jgi:hypothetical protein